MAMVRSDTQAWTELKQWLVDLTRDGAPIGVDREGRPQVAKVEQADADQVILQTALPGGTFQRVTVRVTTLEADEKWVEIMTPVCEAEHLRPREALARNTELVVGHLEYHGDDRMYWYRHTIPMQDLHKPWEQFRYTLSVMVTLADWMELDVTGEDKF
jgi:hypothetical protein